MSRLRRSPHPRHRVRRLDFVVHGAAFAPAAELSNRFIQTSRDGFKMALDIAPTRSVLAGACVPLMDKRGGRYRHAVAHRRRPRVPELTMGVARPRSKRACAIWRRIRAAEHPRECCLGRPDQDAGLSRHSRVVDDAAGAPERAPMRRGMELGEIADGGLPAEQRSRAITGEV
jgi:enoyl-[acyl-carrier protein] reductase I